MIARIVRVVLAVCAAAGVLLLGAYAGGAFPAGEARAAAGRSARASDEQRYDQAPEAGEIAVGDALSVNGQPMQLSIFFTSDTPERVVHFYAEAFRARALTPVATAVHVSAFDPRDGWQRFISAVPQPGRQTMVLIGATNPRRPPRLVDSAKSAGFPVPDQSRGFLGYRSEDAGRKAETAQFVSPLSAEELAAFYRARLSADGFAERAAQGLLTFAKGSDIVSIGIQALDEKRGAAVFVTRSEGGAQ